MPIVQSFGALQSYGDRPAPATLPRASSMDTLAAGTYAQYYRTQPNIRTVVDFLARNMAQLGLHAYRRVSDLDRVRLVDHDLVTWVTKPNPSTTRYRLVEDTMHDLGIHFNAYWLKLRMPDRIGLVRLPPECVQPDGWLLPSAFYWLQPDGRVVPLAPRDLVHFNGFDPASPLTGLSTIETLRQLLAEDAGATLYRRAFWANAARLEGVIQRPAGAPKWTPDQKQQWREQWQERYGANPGQVAVLEDGMTYKEVSANAVDSELTAARKLTREECAAAYHVPLPMVGILDHATFCLPGDTEIFTEDGPRAIRDVRVGDRVWSRREDGAWLLQPVQRSACTGTDEILTLRTGNRTLRLNARHRVLARRAVLQPAPVVTMRDGHRRALGRAQKVWTTDYVPAGELRVDDTIVILKRLPPGDDGRPIPLPSGRVATIGFLELCGLILGDGNVTRVKGEPVGLQIARAASAPYMDAYRAAIRTELDYALPGTRIAPLHLIEGGRQTRLMSVAAGRELDRLGLGGTARTKRVPGWVFGLPEAYRLALLRGFLDADGSCDKRGRLSFSSCSRALLSQIRHLCLSVGVPVTNLREQRGVTRLPTGRMAAFAQWCFTCSDPGPNRRIGSHTPLYQDRLRHGQPFQRKTSRYPWQGGRGFADEGTQLAGIIEISRQPAPEPVYDLAVAETHSFIADGVVVHNSNVKEQHKHLYQDCLGPWCIWLGEELERQLLIECEDQDRVYLEFNIAEKLKGSFEEQAAAFQTLVGRPVMTVNEARGRLNLTSIKDDPSADAVATPLNLSVGAASPATVAAAATAPVIQSVWARQRARLEKLPPAARAAAFETSRWDRELTRALEPLYRAVGASEAEAARAAAAVAVTVNADTLQLLVAGEEAFSSAREAALYVDASLQPVT